MKTLKTIMMALSLASTPAALYAQEAAPAASTTVEAAAPAAAAPAAPAFQHRAPEADIGQPIPGGFKLQPQVTKVGEDAQWLHDSLLMPIITIITIFVLLLLVYAVIRFRAKANPVPSKTSHNTLIEIVWTLFPVLILLVIAVPSIRLVAAQYAQPKADLTIKAIGNQWYWTYQYPDNGDFELVSNMLPDAEAKKRGEPRMLAVDERVVVPVNSVVKMIVTSNDVIHSWAVPAFWTKMDAVPGRLNETWFKAEREGLYYGQCSELCGARHGYMPIAVEVVSKEKFAEWVRSKGGSLPGEKVAEAAVPPAPAAAEPAAPATETAPAAPATSQPATAQN
ncbi:MAG: cytochrome c oxidase subunit II [Pseudomonadota bacterium]|uniref:cytochrome c oxidase subunit II n=1 Tax=Rhizorhabdus phycosphaerae TaxID=2711156 RepID=UPI0013E9DE71|nr:cytochrome c oxidase subunit II [Rhizorhabdus phycosphaerae]